MLIFGDSWPFGSELSQNELSYGQLLAEKLGHNLALFAQPSTSIPHLILQLRNAIAQGHRDCIAVFFLTGVDRDLLWDQGKTRELNPTHPEDLDWYSRYNSPELSTYRVNTTLVSLQAICAKYNITDYYIWGWDNVDLWKEVDQTRVYKDTVADVFLEGANIPAGTNKIMYLKNSKNRYIWPNSGHPNQLGHQRIADLLQEWICT